MKVSLLLYPLLLLFFIACSDDKIIKDEEKFARFYVDLLILRETYSSDQNRLSEQTEKLLKNYGISEKQFNATISYYNSNPERWKDFFDKVTVYMTELKNKATRKEK